VRQWRVLFGFLLSLPFTSRFTALGARHLLQAVLTAGMPNAAARMGARFRPVFEVLPGRYGDKG